MKNKNQTKTVVHVCVVAGVLLFAACATMTTAKSPTTTKDEIASYILQQLSYHDDDNILSYIWGPVAAGVAVQATKESVFTTPCAGYVMYIDPSPLQNLFHPVRYMFLTQETRAVSVFDATSPPQNFGDYMVVDTPYNHFFYSVQNRRASSTHQSGPEKSDGDSRWVVLMNGGYDQYNNHIRYWDDLSNIYKTVNQVYEIPDENIIVLCSDGLNPAPDQSNGQNSNPDLDGDGDEDIMYSCILSNVDMVFTSLAANFTGNEKLFVFTTDHGNTAGGWNTVENLWNQEELTDAHFAELLAAFPDCEKICTLEPCFSGGFLDNIIVPPGPIVGSSACRYDESSWAMSDLQYDEYVFHWTAAINGHDAYGNPVDADADENGIVSMKEAYDYAVAHDVQSESPQYGEYPEGTGSYLSLWVTSAPPAQPAKPTGPTLGIWHIEYAYASSTTEPDNEPIFYLFDWGDDNNSGWLGPYTSGQPVSGTHTWDALGVFPVRVKARDSWGATSPWSETLNVTITDNTPPEIPTITGPGQGKPGTQYLFNLETTDAQDQNVYYFVDWGDNTTSGWFGPYVQGTTVHVTHAWAQKGNYTVKAKAKDTFDSESGWGTLHILVPTEYTFSLQVFLQHLLDRFPHLFPVLRHLMGC
jgi:hypothetical protein